MKKVKRINKTSIFYSLAVLITLGFLALTVFKFRNGFYRIWESIRDLGTSAAFYFVELFELDFSVNATVTEFSVIPITPVFNFPDTWSDFVIGWKTYWTLWISKSNIALFFEGVGEGAEIFAKVMLIAVVPLILVLYILFEQYMNKTNNNYNKDSKPLVVCRRIADVTYKPLINFVKEFIGFIQENSNFAKFWLLIWCFNLNVIVIVVEFIAYYLYLVSSFEFASMYVQVVKLVIDLSVPIAFIPGFAWAILGIWLFDYFRKKIGYAILHHHEAMNCGFINERSLNVLTCGTMGKKKTTLTADMLLLQEKMFRDKALELMIENDMKFPNFPWINFENHLKKCIYAHKIYNLATIRKHVRHLKLCFEKYCTGNERRKESIRRHLKIVFDMDYENVLFDYDYKRYGLYYDDKLKVTNIFVVLSSYAQEYFIYTMKSSLIIANFSVRTDSIISDLGNLPMRDNDFYKRNSKFIEDMSRYAHIVDYDAMRLNVKVQKDNPKKDSLDFGAIGESENGKERKNNLQLQEVKKKDDVANQKNDGYTDYNKMMRHAATIDYHSFIRKFGDEQRPESLGADVRDTYDIIHIKDGGKTKLALPFFFVEELLYSIIYDRFVRLYLQYRYVRGDNTLLIHILKKIVSRMQNYYKGIYNTFGYAKMKLQVESGTLDGELTEKAYYLDNKRIYSDRFATDCFSDFFETKTLRSKIGINDLEEYESSRATMDELKMQNSYFITELINKQENDK